MQDYKLWLLIIICTKKKIHPTGCLDSFADWSQRGADETNSRNWKVIRYSKVGNPWYYKQASIIANTKGAIDKIL